MGALERLRKLLISIDPTVTKYEGNGKDAYTVWTPYGEEVLFAGDSRAEIVVKVQVDRFTKIDNDQIAVALYQALDKENGVAFEYQQDYEQDTGYIHHIFDCEVI